MSKATLTPAQKEEVLKEAKELLSQVLIVLKDVEKVEIENDYGSARIVRPTVENEDGEEEEDYDADMEVEALKSVVERLLKGSAETLIEHYYTSTC